MRFFQAFLGLLVASTLIGRAISAEPKPTPDPPKAAAAEPSAVEKAIQAGAKAFVEAFDRGDAKAVAATWTPDGEYVDEQGKAFQGRQAIEKHYAEFFATHPGLSILLDVQSIRLLATGTAVEEGAATIISDEAGPLARSRYTAMHVQQDGQWLAASVRESEAQLLSNFPTLIDFESLIGDWIASGDGTSIQTSFRWTANKQFVARTFSASQGDQVMLTGMQMIGWDPTVGHVASWIFDSDGGHGHGTWTRKPNGWSVASEGVLRDGTRTSATYLLTRVDDKTITWQSVHRKLGDAELPDTAPVTLKRVPAAKQADDDKAKTDALKQKTNQDKQPQPKAGK